MLIGDHDLLLDEDNKGRLLVSRLPQLQNGRKSDFGSKKISSQKNVQKSASPPSRIKLFPSQST
jgi:hypothetical protein